MKRISFFLAVLVCMLLQTTVAMADDVVIPVSQLPEAAKSFVQKQFPKQKISRAEKDIDGIVNYEVRLSNGAELDFDKDGNWQKIDCKRKAVPAVLVPNAISSYVKQNYPKSIILKIEKKQFGYEIDLSKGPDLNFDQKGTFIGIDD